MLKAAAISWEAIVIDVPFKGIKSVPVMAAIVISHLRALLKLCGFVGSDGPSQSTVMSSLLGPVFTSSMPFSSELDREKGVPSPSVDPEWSCPSPDSETVIVSR